MSERDQYKSPPIPSRQWQRPWLVDADLRSDDAIEVGCPDTLTGERLMVKFTTTGLRLFMSGANEKGAVGGLVVDRNLIRDLTQSYGHYGATNGKPPDAIEHVDYPFKWFVPLKIKTYRKMSGAKDNIAVPGPVKVLIFLAASKARAMP